MAAPLNLRSPQSYNMYNGEFIRTYNANKYCGEDYILWIFAIHEAQNSCLLLLHLPLALDYTICHRPPHITHTR